MSTGYECKINDPNTALAYVSADESVRIQFAFNFPATYTRPPVTALEYQFIKTDKYKTSVSGLSTKANCTALSAITDPAIIQGAAIWAGPTTDPMRNILYFDLGSGIVTNGWDYVTIAVYDPSNPEVWSAKQIQIIKPNEYTYLRERGTINSDIGTISGSPGSKRYFALYTRQGGAGGPNEFGPEIIGATAEIKFEEVSKRFSLPILGSYYYDHTTNTISQLKGIAASLGIAPGVVGSGGVSIGDILVGVTSENGDTVSGYTFILDAPVDFTGPGAVSADTKIHLTFNNRIVPFSGEDYDVQIHEGAIWFDQNASETNSIPGKTGTPNNPVSSGIAVNALITETGLPTVKVKGTLTQATNLQNKEIVGIDGNAKFTGMSSYSLQGSRIKNMIYENAAGHSSTTFFIIDTCRCVSLAQFAGDIIDSKIAGGAELNSFYGIIRLLNCYNSDDTSLLVTYTTNNFKMIGWKGNVTVQDGDAVCDIHMQGGVITLNVGITGGTINLTGFGTLIDNSINPTVNTSGFQNTPISLSSAVTLSNNSTNKSIIGEGAWNTQRSLWGASGTFGEFTPANILRIAGQADIDGKTLTQYHEILLAYANGRFRINYPNPGDVSLFKQDNSTVLWTFNVSTVERARV